MTSHLKIRLKLYHLSRRFGLNCHIKFKFGNLPFIANVQNGNMQIGRKSFFSVLLISIAIAAKSQSVHPALPVIPAGNFNITNYGAIGDDATVNTTFIQSAIDAASTAGGGSVNVPAGIFLSGPIKLNSKINLHLEKGALLRM